MKLHEESSQSNFRHEVEENPSIVDSISKIIPQSIEPTSNFNQQTLSNFGLTDSSYFAISNPKSCLSSYVSRFHVTCYYCVSTVTSFLTITQPLAILISANNQKLYIQSKTNQIITVDIPTRSTIGSVSCKFNPFFFFNFH